MGGRFRLESEPGRGTTAIVEIESGAASSRVGNAV
jgi:hypothetical protein